MAKTTIHPNGATEVAVNPIALAGAVDDWMEMAPQAIADTLDMIADQFGEDAVRSDIQDIIESALLSYHAALAEANEENPPMTIRDDIDQLTLAYGAHNAPDDGMCVMEAIAWITDDDFDDQPACVSPVIRAFSISLNDSLNDTDRNRFLKPLMLDMVDTNTGRDDDLAWMATDWLVRVHAPVWLRLAGLDEQADILAALPELGPDTIPPILPTLEAIRQDAIAAALVAGGYAAWETVLDADAAGNAARAATRAAGGAAGGYAAWDAALDAAAAGNAARAAGGAAAWDSLQMAVDELNPLAVDLLKRMCAHAKEN